MWTTKQANRSTLVMDLLAVAVIVAMAAATAVRGEWDMTILLLLTIVGLVIARSRRRRDPDREDTAAVFGTHARDEREAAIQLRAWALVGRAAVFAAFVLLAAEVIRGRPTNVWAWVVLAGVLLYVGCVVRLRQRT